MRDTLGSPLGACRAAHVNDRQIRVEFASPARDIPTIWSSPEVDVGYQAAQRLVFRLQNAKCLVSICCNLELEPALTKRFFKYQASRIFILDEED